MNTDRQLEDCKCGNCADCRIKKLEVENLAMRIALSDVRWVTNQDGDWLHFKQACINASILTPIVFYNVRRSIQTMENCVKQSETMKLAAQFTAAKQVVECASLFLEYQSMESQNKLVGALNAYEESIK